MVTTHKLAIRALAGLLAGMALSTLACGDGATAPPAAPTPSALWLTPATIELSALGDTARLSADVRDFAKALAHRLVDEVSSAAALAAPVRSLLLWGGVDTTGTPFLHPAFAADAPPTLPDSAGAYTVTGRDASGQDLFSLSFAMPVALSEEGEVSSFAFALPIQPGWAALASVTLSGPDGTATLDGDSDMPMAILRDPRSGQVRGFLRDLPPVTQAAMDAAGQAAGAGLDVLFSRGIPGSSAWRR